MDIEKKNLRTQKQIRFRTHILMSLILVIVIIIYKNYLSTSVIDSLLIIAGFTYGPLLGLFSFGIITNHKIHDNLSIIVCLLSVLIITFIFYVPSEFIGGYKIGYELLPMNGLLTFIGLYIIRKKTTT